MALKVRVFSALVFGPALLAAIFFASTPFFDWFCAALVALGGWEWARLAGVNQPALRALYAVASSLGVAIGLSLAGAELPPLPAFGEQPRGIARSVAYSAMLLWLVNLAWLSRRRFLGEVTVSSVFAKLGLGLVVLICAGISLALIRHGDGGVARVLVFFLIIWAADVGAYAAGRLLGRRKLAPEISPGKTWEGVVGGQLLVAAVAGLCLLWLPEAWQPGPALLLWAALTAAVSVVGDLYISLLKRQRGIKDTGRLLPGHGGILDRFDSAFAAAPIFLAGLLASGSQALSS
ncbi:MAG: phosphatidate cytidylyltransferase [Pseudomonadota bacterium]